jgi:hypothetical protein
MTNAGNGWRALLALLLSTTLLGFSADAANAAGKRKMERDAAKNEKQEPVPQGPLTIVVSLDRQRLSLYGNGVLFAESPVSSGTASRPTPTGVFSVIQKDRYHRSNLYNDAPMPYMQRITWSGVAMHTGVLPGYPASHGCIRLPDAFAQKLWRYTKLGARVIVARDAPEPYEISHPRLFNPKPVETVKLLDAPAAALTRTEVKTAEVGMANKASDAPKPAAVIEATKTEPAKAEISVKADDSAPASTPAAVIESTEGKPAETKVDVAQSVEAAKPVETTASTEAAKPVEVAKPVEAAKAAEPAKSDDPARTGAKTQDKAQDAAKPVQQAVKAAPLVPVSVFISRKTGKLYVRKGFEPLFETAVTIRDADKPMGTHVFTALELQDGGAAMRWNAISMHSETPRRVERAPERKSKKRGQADEIATKVPDANPVPGAKEALERIEIPQETVDRIASMLVPGSSLMISDNRMSDETGKYTDFIISTRAAR